MGWQEHLAHDSGASLLSNSMMTGFESPYAENKYKGKETLSFTPPTQIQMPELNGFVAAPEPDRSTTITMGFVIMECCPTSSRTYGTAEWILKRSRLCFARLRHTFLPGRELKPPECSEYCGGSNGASARMISA